MRLSDLAGKSICILGFGKEGQATLRAVERHAANTTIFLADANPTFTHEEYPVIAGPDYLENIDVQSFDAIIKSPGIPPHPLFAKWGKRLTSGTQIFLDTIADSGAIVIGVTGSKGKSTTSKLIAEMLRMGGKNVWLIGNIGEPALDHLDDARPGVIFVQEMSSYQLMDLTRSPQIAVVTSFFPEHLDYHGTLAAYKDAKAHITRFQTPDDAVFFAKGSTDAADIALQSPGRHIAVGPEDCPVNLQETRLIGDHNRSNIALACAVARDMGVTEAMCKETLKHFLPLPHRLQHVPSKDGITWIDDAISTTPESTIAGLKALDGKTTTLILGGQDRGNDFIDLAHFLATSSVQTIILFPGSGPRIRTALESAHAKANLFDAPTMEEAITIARHETQKDGLVLLSTASPSYNMFKNFEEKGEKFQECIKVDRVHPSPAPSPPGRGKN